MKKNRIFYGTIWIPNQETNPCFIANERERERKIDNYYS